MTIRERLQQILAEDYNLSPEKLAPEARLDELGIDSLGVMELMFRIEDEFHIKIPSDQADLATVGDVAAYIQRLATEQNAPLSAAGSAS